MQSVIDHLQQNEDSALEELFEFLSIQSVSADSAFQPEMQRCAEFVQQAMQRAGLSAEIIPTPGHPVVLGQRIEDPELPTVLIYGHYDVQPPDPLELWTSPPFEPVIRDGRIFARGATDDKGQLFTHLKSIQAGIETEGRLPVNVKFLVEGEEEVGSDNLDNYLESNRETLAADVGVISDTSQYGDGIPAITYGLRGIIAAEVRLTGPSKDLHSGVYGGSISNPVNALAAMCGALIDSEGRIQIPGFYDGVSELSEREQSEFARLPFSEDDFLSETGSTATFGETGFSTLQRRWARPTCDINGIVGGYTGEGPKTIVPSKAMAKITCRLVPGQDPEQILNALQQFLQARVPPGIQMEFLRFHGCPAFGLDPDSPWMGAAGEAMQDAFGQPPVFIREGGSIPVVSSFQQILGIDTLLLGWGRNTDNLHSPDEHFHVCDFHNGTRASALLWQKLADLRKQASARTAEG